MKKINAKLKAKRKRLSQEFEEEEEGAWEPLDHETPIYPRTTYARKSSRRKKKVLDKQFYDFRDLDRLDRLVGIKSEDGVPNASDDELSVKKEDDEEYIPDRPYY